MFSWCSTQVLTSLILVNPVLKTSERKQSHPGAVIIFHNRINSYPAKEPQEFSETEKKLLPQMNSESQWKRT